MARGKRKFRLDDGLEKMRQVVELLNDGLNDPEFEKYIGLVIARMAVKRIKRYIREGGKPTEPLSDVTSELTKNLRNRRRGGARPLNDTRDLYNSIKVISFNVSGNRFNVDVGITDPEVAKYAYLQEYGGHPNGAVYSYKKNEKGEYEKSLSGYVPARPFLRPGMNDAMYEAFDGKISRIINKAVKAMADGKNWRKVFLEAKV